MSASASVAAAASSGRGRHRYVQRGKSRGERGGGGGGHQKFVPKQEIPSPSTSPAPTTDDQAPPQISSRPRLTTPLRVSDSGGASGCVTFLNYLPQDEALASGLGDGRGGGSDAVESQAVVDVLNDELSWLLKLRPRVLERRNDTLRDSLDSYLKYRNRWYDLPHRGVKETVAGVLVGENELNRRVFMTFYRMSSNKDPGSSSHDCLSAKEHTSLLQEKRLLDLPILLDLCGIYGHDNEELTKLLIYNAMNVQPLLAENFKDALHHFLGIIDTMHQRCMSSLELQLLVSYEGRADHALGFHEDLLEVMDFINDTVMTVDAFVSIYRPAAVFFSLPTEISDRKEDLLTMLRKLHDSLLPSLHQGLTLMSSNGGKIGNQNNNEVANITHSLKLLSNRIVNFGWKLLETCYLSDEFLEDVSFPQTTKMFPVKVDDPVTRGDILVQAFTEINRVKYEQNVKIQEYGTFLQNVEKQFFLLSRIDSLRSSGWMFLDDGQFHYISQIIFHSSGTGETEAHGHASSISKAPTVDEDAVIMESKISQINDLFPDYGKGFLCACLDVYNQDPEEVIQRILDGTLHEDLLSLDTTLEQISPSKASSTRINDKGKGKLMESTTDKGKGRLMESTTEKLKDKGKGLLLDSPSHVNGMPSPSFSSDKRVDSGPSHSLTSSNGRYMRKPKDVPKISEVLDSQCAKDSVRSMVLAAAEYEDEYDDSFDDLGLNIVETGIEENNLDEEGTSLSGKSWDSSKHKLKSENQVSKTSSWVSQKTPQFYVKDGKNYSYKVSGSVAVRNAQEAAMVNQAQREMIHGLGHGGNIPVGAVRNLADVKRSTDSHEDMNENSNLDGGGRGMSSSRGRGGGRGRRGGGNQYRKNQAMRKHFAGLSGF